MEHQNDIFIKLKQGLPVNILDEEYTNAVRHMEQTIKRYFRQATKRYGKEIKN